MTAPCSVEGCDGVVGWRGMCWAHAYRVKKHGDPGSPFVRRAILGGDEARFWTRVSKTDGGCWLWTGYRNANGYGVARAHRRQVLAHRYAYELLVGAIPDGLTLDHLCRVRDCVNPAHLEPVTMRENNLRGMSLQAQNARKTHCKRGHPFDEANTLILRNGHRRCRACRDEWWKAYSGRYRPRQRRNQTCLQGVPPTVGAAR